MLKVIAIGGEPATGKTTLVKRFIKESRLEFKRIREGKLLDLLYNEESDIYVLGIYEEGLGTFQGTDKLSMAVQPDAISFFDNLKNGKVIFEGDRLFNSKLLSYLSEKFPGEDLKILVLVASDKTLNERHIYRKDNQDDTFKNSRKTKIRNILSNLDLKEHITVIDNENDGDSEKALNLLLEFK